MLRLQRRWWLAGHLHRPPATCVARTAAWCCRRCSGAGSRARARFPTAWCCRQTRSL